MSRSQLMPVEQALARLLEQVGPVATAERVPLSAALGRVLVASQQAGLDVPAYDNSAMDGYALRAVDLQAPDTVLPISQTIAAGHPGVALQAGSAARIFTGAPIPAGADVVVMQENTEILPEGVRILEQPRSGQNIRLHGHDIRAGSVVLEAGHCLQPQDLGLLASLGICEVEVRRPLTVAILNTGDEVVAPGQVLAPGQLYDSNSFTLDALLARLGLRVLKLGIVADTLEATEVALREAAARADCLITTGGVSVGDEDHVRAAVERLGELHLWKLAIKPGKPFSFGRVQGVPIFGLPGNPVAVFVTFVALVRPALLKMQGASQLHAPAWPVPLGFDVREAGSRQEYLRVQLVQQGSAEPSLQSFADQGSSVLTSLSWANGLAVIPPYSAPVAGERVLFMPFGGLY
jgi:molybdopterin molybdotransferase